jgi:hypothetical protein
LRLSEIVVDGDPAAILGALDLDIIPVAACYALVNIYFTVIVCVLCSMLTKVNPCRERPAQDLM